VILAKHNRSEQMFAIKVMEKEIIVEQDAVERIMSEHNVLLGNEVGSAPRRRGIVCALNLPL
jgi:hypothetical protein